MVECGWLAFVNVQQGNTEFGIFAPNRSHVDIFDRDYDIALLRHFV